jgi:hypothetical protein
MSGDELTEESRTRLYEVLNQDYLSLEVLRENVGVDPEAQIECAKEILEDRVLAESLIWDSRFPDYPHLNATLELGLKHFPPERWQNHGAVSPAQLALFTQRLSTGNGDVSPLIARQLEEGVPADDAVEKSLDFVRFWPGHNLPKLLRTMDNILAEVIPRLGLEHESYGVYTGAVEQCFLPPFISELEEYGLPVKVALKLGSSLRGLRDMDHALEALDELARIPAGLTPVEVGFLDRVRLSLM